MPSRWSATDLDEDRHRIVCQIFRCDDIPRPETDDLCYRLATQPFSWCSAPRRLERLAFDVARASHYSESDEVRRIKESLYDLADRLTGS